MPAEQQETARTITERRRTEDFVTRYANNAYLEASAWDLKFIFGQVDQTVDPTREVVLQHTSLTMPWPQVKMMTYLMQVHIAMHETRIGKVNVPSGMIYKVTGDMPSDFREQFPEGAEELWQKLRALYDTFIEENPEAE